MASPRREIYLATNATSGAPLSGLTPTFLTYKDETGTNLTQPSITEVGTTGIYMFTPTLQINHIIVYVIDNGASAANRYEWGTIRAEEYDIDLVAGNPAATWDVVRSGHVTAGTYGALMRLLTAIFAGRVVIDSALGTIKIYDLDGTTLLQTQLLFASDGTTPKGLDAVIRSVSDTLP
jgi:hypothetical protein